jgi:hypothetical protein
VQLTLHKLKMENVKLKIMVCALRTDLIISGGNTLIFNFQFSIFNSFHRNDKLKFETLWEIARARRKPRPWCVI